MEEMCEHSWAAKNDGSCQDKYNTIYISTHAWPHPNQPKNVFWCSYDSFRKNPSDKWWALCSRCLSSVRWAGGRPHRMDWIICTLQQIIVQRTCIYTVQSQYSGFRLKLLVFEERQVFSKIKTQHHLKTVSSFHAVSWIILRMESIPPDFFSSPTGIDRSRGRDIWHILHFAPNKVK